MTLLDVLERKLATRFIETPAAANAAASKAGVKAAGVVVDDAAVTPRYVQGFLANRE